MVKNETKNKNTRLPMQETKKCKLDPWVETISWRRAWQPTPVFLPGKSRGQRSLMGYSLWGHVESDTERLTLSDFHFSQKGRNEFQAEDLERAKARG